MKKQILLFIGLIAANVLLAQVPQGISHQAVMRDAENNLIVVSSIGLQVRIIQGTHDGDVVYVETHHLMTNQNGLISCIIGDGDAVQGVFQEIDWADGPYWLETKADPEGGINYSISGTAQLLSVPYALHAGSAGDNQWEQDSWGNIYRETGNVGIGVQQPEGKLHVSVPGEWLGVVFTGTGLDDLDVDISAYNGMGATAYAVRIENTGPVPNTVETSSDGGTTWSVPIPIAPEIDMGYGVIVNFGSTSGYTYDDRWDWTVNESFEDVLVVKDDRVGIGVITPSQALDVHGNIRLSGGDRSLGTWSAHNLNLTTNSTTRMTITSAGNVGIGTTSPSSKLHISGDARINTYLGIGAEPNNIHRLYAEDGSANAVIHGFNSFQNTNGLAGIAGTTQTAGNGYLGTLRNGIRAGVYAEAGTWSTGSTNYAGYFDGRLVVMNGNVGIETTNPTQALEVNGNIRLSGGHRSLGTWSAHNLNLTTNGLMRMSIAPGGNVGIGTTIPTYAFDVRGDKDARLAYFLNTHNSGSAGEQSSVYGYLSFGQEGAGYGVNVSRAPVKGYAHFGYGYAFGVAGYRFNDNYNRGGGVFGGSNSGTTPLAWGSLGYRTSAGTHFGGYFTGSTTGSGKTANEAMIHCGIAAWGDLFGADIHGKIYGMFVEGGKYAIYSNGVTYKNNLDVHLQENGSNTLSVLYTNVSNEVTVQTSGIATLSNGKASIMFDPVFAATVSDKEPVIVTVTPMGNSNGVYLESVDSRGFAIVENNNGKSNVMVNYIAIGRRTGYENPSLAPEVIDAEYVSKIARGLHNDGITETDGVGLYYENGKLVVGKHPSTMVSEPKPVEPDFIQNHNLNE